MLSTQVPAPFNLKESIKSLTAQFVTLKEAYHDAHHDMLFGGSREVGIKKIEEIINASRTLLVNITKIIKHEMNNSKKIDPAIMSLRIKIVALRMWMVMATIGFEDEQTITWIENELDIELIEIGLVTNPKVFEDPSVQGDVYFLVLVKREIEENKQRKPTKQEPLTIHDSDPVNLLVKEKKKNNPFIPVHFLPTIVNQSSDGINKLRLIRALFVELIIHSGQFYQLSQPYIKLVETSYKHVLRTQFNRTLETVDEFHKLLDVVSASFIYYQLWLVNSSFGYRSKNNKEGLRVIAERENLTSTTIKLSISFDADISEAELDNYIKKERVFRKDYMQCFELLSLINFEKIPRDYQLIRRIGEVIEEGRVHAVYQSHVFSGILDAYINKKKSMQKGNLLSEYCAELKEVSNQWVGLSARYNQSCFRPTINSSVDKEKTKQIEQQLDKEILKSAEVQNQINNKIELGIKEHRERLMNLKKKTEDVYVEIVAAENRREKLHAKNKAKASFQSEEKSDKHLSALKNKELMQLPAEKALDVIIKTEKQNNVVRALEKLDEKLTHFGRELLGKIKKIHQVLTDQMEAKKAMKDGSINNLYDSLQCAVDDLNQLMVLRVEYQDQIRKSGPLNEFEAGALMSIEEIDGLVSKSQLLLSGSMELLRDNIERIKQDKNDFIIRLGIQEAKMQLGGENGVSPEVVFTHQQIQQMGWERFKKIGEEKRQKGLPLSNISLVRQFMESLLEYYLPKITKIETKVNLFASNQVAATIILPESIRQAFHLLDGIEGKHYLTGSLLYRLIKQGKDFNPASIVDIDFTTDSSDPGKVFDANNKFRNSEHVRRLCQLKDKNMKLDLYLSDPLIKFATHEEWMRADVEARNFTISSLLCDRYGHIYDLTGRGLIDIKDNVLSTIKSSKKLLDKDPTNIFSAFKKMVEGYSPDQDLKDALRSWQPKADFNKSRVYAIVKKHLKVLSIEDALKYVNIIFQYNMQEKVFGFRSVESPENMLERIKKVVGLDQVAYAPTLFADASRTTHASMGSDPKRDLVLSPHQ